MLEKIQHMKLEDPVLQRRQMKVAVYARKSTAEGRSKSVQEQIDFCTQIAKHYGFDEANITIYREEHGQKGDWLWQDMAGRNPKPWRPQLTQMMRDVEDGKISVVMVWRSDRLYRDNGVADALMKIFRAKGVSFISSGRDLDITTSGGYYLANVEAASNKRYSEQISEDVRRDHETKVLLGMFSHNPSALGLRSRKDGMHELEVLWDEVELVNRIFRMFVTGDGGRGPMSFHAIAETLMKEGVILPYISRGPRPKDPSFIKLDRIKSILTNPIYIGRWRYRGEEYEYERLLFKPPGHSGPPVTLVPPALFEAAQEKIRLQEPRGKRTRSGEHMLTGVVVCAGCGRPMVVNHDGSTRKDGTMRKRFFCKWYRTGKCKQGSSRRIQEEVLNDWVLRELAPIIATQISQTQAASGQEVAVQRLASLNANLEVVKQKETKLLLEGLYLFDAEQMKNMSSSLRVERELLSRQVDEQKRLVDSLQLRLPDIPWSQLSELPPSAVKDALRQTVEWIAVGREGIVVLTKWGSYIGGRFSEHRPDTFSTGRNKRTIQSPDAISAIEALTWIKDPENFILGRRHYLGEKANHKSDAEMLPGGEASPKDKEQKKVR